MITCIIHLLQNSYAIVLILAYFFINDAKQKIVVKTRFLQKNENRTFLTVILGYYNINCEKQLKREKSTDKRV